MVVVIGAGVVGHPVVGLRADVEAEVGAGRLSVVIVGEKVVLPLGVGGVGDAGFGLRLITGMGMLLFSGHDPTIFCFLGLTMKLIEGSDE